MLFLACQLLYTLTCVIAVSATLDIPDTTTLYQKYRSGEISNAQFRQYLARFHITRPPPGTHPAFKNVSPPRAAPVKVRKLRSSASNPVLRLQPIDEEGLQSRGTYPGLSVPKFESPARRRRPQINLNYRSVTDPLAVRVPKPNFEAIKAFLEEEKEKEERETKMEEAARDIANEATFRPFNILTDHDWQPHRPAPPRPSTSSVRMLPEELSRFDSREQVYEPVPTIKPRLLRKTSMSNLNRLLSFGKDARSVTSECRPSTPSLIDSPSSPLRSMMSSRSVTPDSVLIYDDEQPHKSKWDHLLRKSRTGLKKHLGWMKRSKE